MPDIDVIDEENVSYEEEYDNDRSPSPAQRRATKENARPATASAPSGSKAAAAAPQKSTAIDAWKGPSLPVSLPHRAVHPSMSLGAPSSAASTRTRETLIINRSKRGASALQPKDYACAHAKDFSHMYPVEAKTYERGYINELAYCDAMKARNAEKQKAEDAKRREEEREDRRRYMNGGRKGRRPDFEGGGSESGGGGLAEFFDRQVAVERRREEARVMAKAEADYASNQDKKVCHSCGGVQSYAELKGGVKRCPKESCGGALYRPKMIWAEVQSSFLGRWEEFNKRRDESLRKLDAETMPPFRVTSKIELNRETGELEAVEIPKLTWEEVADEFLQRQEEVVTRVKEAQDAARAERDRAIEKQKPKASKPYKFSKPLPDFFARQAAAVEKKMMTFDERLEALQEL